VTSENEEPVTFIKKTARLLAASASIIAVAAMPAAHAQTMAPMQPQPMAPMQPPPDRIDVYFYSDAPHVEAGDLPGNWSMRQNVVDGDRYELVHTSPAFRQARIRKECGSLEESGAYQQCVHSFDQ
jgi:hypothetical protein